MGARGGEVQTGTLLFLTACYFFFTMTPYYLTTFYQAERISSKIRLVFRFMSRLKFVFLFVPKNLYTNELLIKTKDNQVHVII